MSQIDRAIEILKKGGIVAYPTDTVYGLGADAFNIEAIKRIYAVKQRPVTIPLPVLLADSNKLQDIAVVTDLAWRLIERFWPGGLTLVLPKTDTVPEAVSPGLTVAVRVPDLPLTCDLIRQAGGVLAVTSANLSGQPSPITAREVEEQLGSRIGLILDGGPCRGGVPSTILDCIPSPPLLLRHGAIPEATLRAVIGEIEVSGATGQRSAPGQP